MCNLTMTNKSPLTRETFEQTKDLHSPFSYEETVEAINRFTKQTHVLFLDLVKLGWYFNTVATIGDMVDLQKLITNKDISSVDKLMSNHLKKEYKGLKATTVNLFPNKSEILKRGFRAYEKKQYEYSILIFLTQTDSICKTLTGIRLFGREQKQAKTKKYVDKHYKDTSFISGLLQPLADYGVINKSESDHLVGELNRHKVIHGDDINYGSELNARKMLSLIFFLTTVLTLVEKRE